MKNKAFTNEVLLLGQPKSWAHCFNETCARKQNCLHHLTGKDLPADKLHGMAVYPAADKGGKCPLFWEARIEDGAWGFALLFQNIKEKDHAELRRQMKEYLGSNGTYYKYDHGRLLLTPVQQAWILDLFRKFGYEEGLAFEHHAPIANFRSGQS